MTAPIHKAQVYIMPRASTDKKGGIVKGQFQSLVHGPTTGYAKTPEKSQLANDVTQAPTTPMNGLWSKA
jgi:hypothetical protein